MASHGRERQLILFAVTALLGGVVLLWTLYLLSDVLLVLYVSGVLAIGFSPVVGRIERRYRKWTHRHLPRWASILALYVGLLLLVVVVAAIVVPPFVAQAEGLSRDLPRYLDLVQDALVRAGIISQPWTSTELLARIPAPGSAVAGVLGAVRSVAGVLGAIVTVVVLPYYMLLESSSIRTTFLKLLPRDQRPQVGRVIQNVTEKVGAWLGGQLLLSAIIGSSTAVGLWLLGVPYFYVLAVVAAVGEAVPVVGPIVAAVPAVLVAFGVSIQTCLFVAVFFGLQQFIENHFIVPRVMERQVGVSAVTVIVALLIGTELLGIVGALLAVPTAAIVQVLAGEYLERD